VGAAAEAGAPKSGVGAADAAPNEKAPPTAGGAGVPPKEKAMRQM
jgi:hypothetical protein